MKLLQTLFLFICLITAQIGQVSAMSNMPCEHQLGSNTSQSSSHSAHINLDDSMFAHAHHAAMVTTKVKLQQNSSSDCCDDACACWSGHCNSQSYFTVLSEPFSIQLDLSTEFFEDYSTYSLALIDLDKPPII